MKAFPAALSILFAAHIAATGAARAQIDTGASDPLPSEDDDALRPQSTAERLVSANPTTEGLKWSLPIIWDQSLTVNTFNQRSQRTYDPSYVWWFTFQPRWSFTDNLSVGASETLSYELTNATQAEFNRDGFYGRQVLWEDMRVDVTYTLPQRPADFIFITAFDLRLPLSKFSRARERLFSPGVRLTVRRPFNVLKGLQVAATGAYWGWVAQSNVALAQGNGFPCIIAPGTGGSPLESTNGCVGASATTKHTTRATISASLIPIDRMALELGYTTLWARSFELATACVATLTGEVCLDDDSGKKHWHTFSNFAAAISYDITKYLTGTLSYDTWAEQPDSDGGWENVFFNENTRLIFSLTLRVDGLYADVRDRRVAKKVDEGAVASTD